MREQGNKRGAVLAKLVEEWSQCKNKEAEVNKEEAIKKKQRTNEELEERLRKQTMYSNKLKVVIKLEKLRLTRLNRFSNQCNTIRLYNKYLYFMIAGSDYVPQNNKSLLDRVKELCEVIRKERVSIPSVPIITSSTQEEEEDINILSNSEERELDKFYKQAYDNLDTLIHTRRSWDIYMVKEGGERIPQYFPSEFPLLHHSNWTQWLSK
jgi:DNA repair ATPase RecN